MATETIESVPVTTEKASKSAFFRQSGWMMIATVGGGAFMYLVHSIAKGMKDKDSGEYGLFMTLLQVVTMMGIPTVGLQYVFAHQAAAAITDEQERQLAGVLRKVMAATFILWSLIAVGVFVMRDQVIAWLKVNNPAALWVTVFIGLAQLWFPIVNGLLQGKQNFLWLGWVAIFNGIGRFVAMFAIVGLLGGLSAGGMVAVLLGISTAIIIGGWQVRGYFQHKPLPFAWREWLAHVIPLTLGLGAALFMLSADMIFVRRFFPKGQTDFYAAAGMIGRALVFFTQPLTAVMFPKLVRSTATAQKTDVLKQVLGVTILLGGMAAIGCTILPSLPLRIIYDKTYVEAAGPLVPWFAWAMLPLTLSNVLINSLMARGRFVAVPCLVLVAVCYGVTLYFHHGSAYQVIGTLGTFGSLMVGVCVLFTWVIKPKTTAAPTA